MKRRDFLAKSSLASSLMLVPNFMKAFESLDPATLGYKKLVLIQLSGGNDGLNTIIPHRNDVLLEDIDIFKNYLVISERKNGLNQIKIKPWGGAKSYYLPIESKTYTAYTTTNLDFETDTLRYGYQSMTTPSSIIDFNMLTKEKTLKKEQEVLGGKFRKEN